MPDSQKPTAPGNLTATGAEPNQVNLSWQASSDNVGVTGYRVFRGPIADRDPRRGRDLVLRHGRRRRHLQLRGPRARRRRQRVRSQQLRSGDHAGRLRRRSRSRRMPTRACRPRHGHAPTTRRATCGSTAAPTRPWRASCGSRSPACRPAASEAPSCASTPTVAPWTGRLSTRPIQRGARPRSTGTTVRRARARPPTTRAQSRRTAWVEYDVTSFVTGNGTYSFGLASTSSDGVDFRSREAATLRPELVVTTGAPDTQKPTPPRQLERDRVRARPGSTSPGRPPATTSA